MTPSWSRATNSLAEVRDKISAGALRLAYHAALPVVLDGGFLNLLRVNFFLDPPEALPFEVEAALLLSPLFREIGDGLYEIEPGVRNILLIGLQARYGPERVRQVAVLLEQYTELTPAWHTQPELEQAQQLTALSFIDPARAEAWLDNVGSAGAGHALGQEWFVAMRHRLTGQPNVTTIEHEVAAAAGCLADAEPDDRMAGIHTLALLARLPDTDPAPIVHVLERFLQDHTRDPVEQVAPDVQAALTLIGALPRSGTLDLKRAIIVGADLRGLDFSDSKLRLPGFATVWLPD